MKIGSRLIMFYTSYLTNKYVVEHCVSNIILQVLNMIFHEWIDYLYIIIRFLSYSIVMSTK
jgi:hypothetical protein